MLGRQVLAFLPSQAVPALASLAGVYLFTRFATPREYGLYALAMSVAQMGQAIAFGWLQIGATRLFEGARRDGRLPDLQAATYRGFAATFALFAVAFLGGMAVLPLDAALRRALAFALAIAGLRSLVALNQAGHRGELRAGRYNLIECLQAVMQVVLGVALLHGSAAGADALLAAAVLASLLASLVDGPHVVRAPSRAASRERVAALPGFGLPLSASFAFNYVLAAADRTLVEVYLGPAQLGVYAVAYGLMDRAVGSVFVAVSLVSLPLAIRAFERDGAEAAARQLRANGRLLLALALPAATLLVVLNGPIAAVMIGASFRSEARAIMPWVALAAVMSGFQLHFFDHAFHLRRRTLLSLLATGPAALVNVALNVLLLPRIGLAGAVWATLAGYAVSLGGSIVIGARVQKVPLDLGELARVSAACAAMAAAVLALRPSHDLAGLLAAASVGIASYVVAAWGFDVARSRTRLALRGSRALSR